MRLGRARALDAEGLQERCNGLSRAVAAAGDRISPAALDRSRAVLARAGERLALAPDLTVVALAGSTGAGKSSLFNALVGEDVAGVAVTRPTTQRPTAALWTEPGKAAGLLDWLEVPRWHAVPTSEEDPVRGLVLLDLPDHDSTETSHRAQVDRIVDRADVMVWVLDPQKYADALVHDAYLARYSRHSDVTLVILNQIDRLSQADARACVAHLHGLLAADGLPDARIIGVSARTGAGLSELRSALAEVVAAREAAVRRLAADIATAADELAAAAADAGGAVRAADPRVRARLPEAMADAAGVGLIESAVAESVRRAGMQRTGWPALRWLGRLRPDPAQRLRLGREGVSPELVRTSLPSASPVALAEVATAARDYAAAATAGAPPAWVRNARTVAVEAAEGIGPDLDRAVARAELHKPRYPGWWSVLGACQWLLLACLLAGLLWLGALWGIQMVALIAPDPPKVGRVPWPTLLTFVGVVGGVLLSWLSRMAMQSTASRAARRARAAVVAEIDKVAAERIMDPVDAEMAGLAQFRLGILAAHGGDPAG